MPDEPKPKAATDRRPHRSTATARRQAERKRNVKETLLETAELLDALRGRTEDQEAESLVEIVRRDADRMAETLASMADRFDPAAFVVDHLFGAGGPLSILTSFGPFLRSLIVQAREIRARQVAEWEAMQEEQPLVYPFEPPHADAGTG